MSGLQWRRSLPPADCSMLSEGGKQSRRRCAETCAAAGFPQTEEVNEAGGADHESKKVTLACTECKRRNYVTKKNKRNNPDRIEMNKHCKFCRKHTLHKETK